MTAPVTAPRRSWMGAVESSIAASMPSRRISTQFGGSATVLSSLIASSSGVLQGLARRGIDDLQNVLKGMTCRFVLRPTCQVFSDYIEIGDPTRNIRAHDCVPDRVERDLGALPFLKQRLGICGPLDHGPEGLGQEVSVETVLKEVVLCSTLDRQPGGLLVLRINQQHDRNVGRRAKQTVEGLYAAGCRTGRGRAISPRCRPGFSGLQSSAQPIQRGRTDRLQ